MTRFDPNLAVRRMRITKAGKAVYDEQFHPGVNIIRGENSSGKSTVLNFVHYGLGGDVHEWSEMALLCERVFVEVSLSGTTATLSRLVSESQQQPMEIYFGSLDGALAANQAQWERYPYKRSPTRESFSQVLFRLLEIPEAANEASGNITMHQVMRLLYGDQLSPVDEIFAHEGFDNAKTREAVGRLLCGAFDGEMYSVEIDIRETEKRFDNISAELKSLYRALGQAGHDLTLAWIAEQRARNEEERSRVGDEIVQLQTSAASNEAQHPSLEAQRQAYELVVRLQKDLAAKREERDALGMAIADSNAFISSLDEKLAALKDAELTAAELGAAHFSTCPACYAEISGGDPSACALCKEPFDAELASERIGALINDNTLQLRQSKLLQEHRIARLALVESAHAELEAEWSAAAKRYSEVQRRPTSEVQYALSEQYKRLGYLDRRDEDLNDKAKMIEIIESLSTRKSDLNQRLSRLKDRHEQLVHVQEYRLADAYLEISDQTRSILSQDLKRQDSFENPRKVDFSFAGDRISVDGQNYFSASSRAVLKSAFLLGFHAAATVKEYFRHPRFAMLDTIEDKGMEPARSHNFQRIIVSVCDGANSENQIIFGTAMIADELNTESLTVGRFYTRDNRSLDFSG